MLDRLPREPFSLAGLCPFQPLARRGLSVFGAQVELVLVPDRKLRRNQPGRERPPFGPGVADRILAEESLWSAEGLALTPNIHPFAERQLLLWAREAWREHPRELLEAAFTIEAESAATVLLNTVGAAASISRAHAHLTPEHMPFLGQLPTRPLRLEGWAEPLLRLDVPFGSRAVGVTGDPAERARIVHDLLQRRMTAAVNVVSQDGLTWVFPRCGPQTPGPWFAFALGAAELWGRWCYPDEAPFARATEKDLEQALLTACLPS